MIEIKNKKRHPVQVLIRSRKRVNSFSCLNIPGIGSGKNEICIAEERATDHIDWAEKQGFISTKIVPDQDHKIKVK